ncbi:MAG: LysM peptidoglycan-binding domain-containing protein [Candidatus Moranbacteria bacterium]|nr:LysM peptidoglycan-binding domain-containing protein [Candidatus Moranbacteria bacterium]
MTWKRLQIALRRKTSLEHPLASHGADQVVHYGSDHSFQRRLAVSLKKRFAARKLLSFFREYSATIVVAVCVAAVALINFSSAKGAPGSLFDTFGINPKEKNTLKQKIALQNEIKNNLATAPLADPVYFVSEEPQEEAYSEDAAYYRAPTIQSQVILASYNPTVTGGNGREAKTYIVKEGDTAGSIAARHGISVSTILWANNLSDTSLLKPGDKLSVLPVTGVTYKVQKSDTLDAIVNKFNSDKQKVLAYNELPADEKLTVGQNIILPDGYISAPTPSAVPTAPAYKTGAYGVQYATTPVKDSRAGAGHRFPYGYCTWYVAQRKYVPWGGNAGAWLANARATGKATGRTPKPGAIMVSGESRWGHVAIVESVSGNNFTISEMNYAGFGKKSTRTLSASSGVVKGFIY